MRPGIEKALLVAVAVVVPAGSLAGLGLYAWRKRTTPKSGGLFTLSGTKRDFVMATQQALSEAGIAASSGQSDLLAAWSAFETGWGKTSAFKVNNPCNLTAGSHWTGPVAAGPDTEYDAAGKVSRITQAWRAYATLADGWTDLWAFLGEPRFGAAQAQLLAGDVGFVDALYAGRYFTLPPERYRAGVQAMFDAVRGLS